MDIVGILGRFHLVLIHFPIALVLVAFALEFRTFKSDETKVSVINLMLGGGAVSGILSVIAGLILADASSFQGAAAEHLELHRWLGIASTVLACVAFFLSAKTTLPRTVVMAVTALATGGIVATGHFGGVLVHGDGYLLHGDDDAEVETAPPNAGTDDATTKSRDGNAKAADAQPVPIGKVDFVTQVRPIIQKSCVKKCHSQSKKKGGLRMDKKEFAFKGGESGEPGIVPGDRTKSTVYKLIALPQDHEDYMPSKGKPLTSEQVETIGLWIDQGAEWPEG